MKVSIIGATGYAGAELLRLLNNHPEAQVVHITSESHTGEPISTIYPHLRGIYDQILMSIDGRFQQRLALAFGQQPRGIRIVRKPEHTSSQRHE